MLRRAEEAEKALEDIKRALENEEDEEENEEENEEKKEDDKERKEGTTEELPSMLTKRKEREVTEHQEERTRKRSRETGKPCLDPSCRKPPSGLMLSCHLCGGKMHSRCCKKMVKMGKGILEGCVFTCADCLED